MLTRVLYLMEESVNQGVTTVRRGIPGCYNGEKRGIPWCIYPVPWWVVYPCICPVPWWVVYTSCVYAGYTPLGTPSMLPPSAALRSCSSRLHGAQREEPWAQEGRSQWVRLLGVPQGVIPVRIGRELCAECSTLSCIKLLMIGCHKGLSSCSTLGLEPLRKSLPFSLPSLNTVMNDAQMPSLLPFL